MMDKEWKMESHLELLKTLEGHVIKSVEIEYKDGQAHVEISARKYGGLDTKTVSFSIHLKRVFETLGREEKEIPEDDPRYMLSQIERLTWEGSQLRRALIVSGANMDEVKKMTNNEAWMAKKKETS